LPDVLLHCNCGNRTVKGICEMEHIMKCANWNVRVLAHREEEPDSVLVEERFGISKITE